MCFIQSCLKNVLCSLEKNVYCTAVGWNVPEMSVGSICTNVWLKSNIPYWFSIWIIYPLLRGGYWGPLPLLGCCPSRPSDLSGCLHVYECRIFLMHWPLYQDIMTFVPCCCCWLSLFLNDISIAVFWFPLTWTIFFPPFTLSWYVSLKLKWVSCRRHIDIYFFIHPAIFLLIVNSIHFHLEVLLTCKDLLMPSY